MKTNPVLAPIGLALLSLPAMAQNMVNPADKMQDPNKKPQEAPVVVETQRVSDLREEDRIGSYRQPEWTSHRRFAETRIYVRPEGTAEFELWIVPETPNGGGPTETKTQYEFEFGLPYRFQLDFYLVSHQDGNEGTMSFDEQKFEVRHALADWDEIWGNPTLYFEWAAINEAPDHVETKLLLGGEVASSWHWGTNFVWEQETGGARESGYEITAGLSKTLVDQRFSVGAEVKAAWIDEAGSRGHYDNEVLLGPSFQFRPTPNSHFDLAPLFGCTDDSPDTKVTILFGWEF
ncbi:MAG: hypothetical protein JNK78_14615 [Planctomycetes bacterium]|nr:hypothetical protein [Planctomycetota bacterium]